MTTSYRLAGLIGPTLLVMVISEWINLHIWSVSLAPIVYLNGTLLFVAGLAIVREHNNWTGDWRLLITLVGWVTLLAGLFRMFLPTANQLEASSLTYSLLAFLLSVGVFLTYKAYGRRTSQ